MLNNKNLVTLRDLMKRLGIGAWIMTQSDPHSSEFIADHWTSIHWLSGFTGSAGSLVVLPKQAALWTDGRYHLQAEEELKDTGIELMCSGEPEVPSLSEWLEQHLKATGEKVGFDGNVINTALVRSFLKKLNETSLVLSTRQDLIDEVWGSRPAPPRNPIFCHEENFTGKTREEKILEIRESLLNQGAERLLLTTLDDIAWLLNLRGSDVFGTPVFLAYLILDPKIVQLFVNVKSIPSDILSKLNNAGVHVNDYYDVHKALANFPENSRIIVDPKTTPYNLFNDIPKHVNIIEALSPTRFAKAIKNPVEISSMEDCHRRDGVAMVKFMYWLEATILKKQLTEWDVVEQLELFRSEDPQYSGPSFNTIAGYAANGAIIHYNPQAKTCATLKTQGLLLVDSGAQYPGGTTDITRTFVCGEITEEEKKDYTLVMKSHIALATAHFKKGTIGIQLDAIARQPLWQAGLDYNHGTGHGVGFFLNVHESPPNIGSTVSDMTLKPSMIVTDEPGIYRRGKHGIRLENIMLVKQAVKTSFGEFYKFQALTMVPFDTSPLLATMLSEQEIKWINDYHSQVYQTLRGSLTQELQSWLAKVTQPVLPAEC